MQQCSGKVLNRSVGYCRAFGFSVTNSVLILLVTFYSSFASLIFFCFFLALIVRFLTKRFIGDYEANTGEFLHI